MGAVKELSTDQPYENLSHIWSYIKMKIVTSRGNELLIWEAFNRNKEVICQEEYQSN